jgi:predicted nucleic acid-binding protein
VIVLDASAYVEATHPAAPAPLRLRLAEAEYVHVPHGFDTEVLSAFRTLHRRGRMSRAEVRRELQALVGWQQVLRHPVFPQLDRMWTLACASVSAYDAAYVALATHLGHPLVTCDRRLGRAPSLPCGIEVY